LRVNQFVNFMLIVREFFKLGVNLFFLVLVGVKM
jgi:hypothetical protein